jgi:hypothetical protein
MVRRVSLADFSRIYLNAKTIALADNRVPVRVQSSDVSQYGFAEHVFVAMAKPTDDLKRRRPGSARPQFAD